jgi:hypothetical protein
MFLVGAMVFAAIDQFDPVGPRSILSCLSLMSSIIGDKSPNEMVRR